MTCKCKTLANRLVGDGCDECNLEMRDEITRDNTAEDIAEWLAQVLWSEAVGPGSHKELPERIRNGEWRKK